MPKALGPQASQRRLAATTATSVNVAKTSTRAIRAIVTRDQVRSLMRAIHEAILGCHKVNLF